MKIQPTQSAERIVSLDVLRGFAILGILIMNIQSFSMPEAAYLNPTAYGDFEGINKWVWILSHLFADMKFMTIFSILFGAGIVLFTRRLEAKGEYAPAVHYRRTWWLLVFGLAHAYLFWYGDILVMYAVSALWVVLLRRKKPKTLFITGVIVFSVASAMYLFTGFTLPFVDEASKQEILQNWAPRPEALQKEIAAYRGSWTEQMEHRVPAAFMMQTFIFFFQTGWRASGLMLIGMALFKWGVLSAEKSRIFYRKLLAFGLIAGLAVVGYGIYTHFENGFSMEYSFFIGSQINYWGSFLVSLGYIGLVMIWVNSGIMRILIKSLQAAGQMALSNYLLQTFLCTTLFYGHGFGLFGKLERKEQILVVIGVWALQLILSRAWMKKFRYGPFEWLWRSLTYWRFQPLRK